MTDSKFEDKKAHKKTSAIQTAQSPAKTNSQMPEPNLKRALAETQKISPVELMALQQSIGNQNSTRLIQNRAGSPVSSQIPAGIVQRFGQSQHTGIEREAMAGSFSGEQNMDISFGNWATDFNQINLAGDFIRNNTPIQITNQDLFEIARIAAEERFGSRIAQRMDPARFGVYDPAQHFDNPATDPNAPADVGPVASHINTSREYIRRTLSNALYNNNAAIGRELFGGAMHTTEDFFAHTNFVEIALRRLGVQNIDSRPDTAPQANRDQLVGGIFATADTVVSILHIIGNLLQRPRQPDQPITTSDRIILILLRRQNPTLALAYETFQHVDFAARRSIPGYEIIHRQIQQYKTQQLALLGNAANIASRVTTQAATGGGNLPAHSRLNKDDPSQPHYQLARALAVFVIHQITPLMREAWRIHQAIPPGQSSQPESTPPNSEMASVQAYEQNMLALINQYIDHPDAGTWWHQIARPYAARQQSQPPSQ